MFSKNNLTRIGKSIAVFAIAISLLLGSAVPPGMAEDLPLPDPDFHGYIDKVNKTYVYSNADEDTLRSPGEPPQGAPNVVLVMLDDVGFGASEAFGGPVHTPTLNKLVQDGLSYNRFHTTALCSPTRAALLTGRNHHSAATGSLTDISTGFSGYTGLIPQSTATVAQILQSNGYNTAWLGKNHNLPTAQSSNEGPFTRWPNGLGFDYFYGFIGGGGETDQWYPALYENRNPVNQPSYPDEDNLDESYNLTRDLADKAIDWVRYNHSLSPDTPFFLYFAPGATHAPHQPPPSYTEKYQIDGERAIEAGVGDKGMFTKGWDKLRKKICANQKEMGIIPENTRCTARPDEIPAWNNDDEFDDDYRSLMTLQMQTYAGFLEYTDEQVGRVIEAIDDLGEKENTLIVYIVGDNGASAEGDIIGSCNASATYVGLGSKEDNLECREEWGNPGTTPHFAVGWAWALDAPFRWTKQIASYFGGTRNPMVVSWPGHLEVRKVKPNSKEDGSAKKARMANLRDQFLHAIDVAPTILDVVGIEPPESFNGIEQKPIEGASFANTFGPDGADAIPLRDTQYFEMLANRGIYHDGWMASSFHGQLPWDVRASSTLGPDHPALEDEWELFDLNEDFSQSTNLAELPEYSEKLVEMQSLFDREAEKYDVYPIDDRFFERGEEPRPTVFEDRTQFEFYPGAVFLPGDVAPNVAANSGYVITADLNITDEDSVRGVILASGGGDTGGYSLYVNEDHQPVFEYKYLEKEPHTQIVSNEALSFGPTQVSFVFKFDPERQCDEDPTLKDLKDLKRCGSGSLYIKDNQVACGDIKEVYGGIFAMDSQDVGMDMRAPVSEDYEPPFEFTGGEIVKVRIDIAPSLEQPDSSSKGLTSSKLQPTSGLKQSHQKLIDRTIQEIVQRLGKQS